MPARASTRSACAALTPAFSVISAITASRPIFGSLSSASSTAAACSARPSSSSRPLSTSRLLTRISKRSKPSARIRSWMTRAASTSAGVGRGADGVEVALPELAEAAGLRRLAAPDRAHVIALERRAELADVLGGEAGERHRQVEAQGHVAAAVVREAVELPLNLRLRAHLAEQDFRVFQGRRVDRREAVGAIDRARLFQQRFARNHQLRRIIAEALQRPRLDQVGHVIHPVVRSQ